MSSYTALGFKGYWGSASGPFQETLNSTVTGVVLQQAMTDISDSCLFQDQSVNTDRFYFERDDFLGAASTGTAVGWFSQVSGAGASTSASTAYGIDVSERALGLTSLATGTTAAGYAEIYKYPSSMINTIATLRLRARIGLQILSNGTDRYQSIFGFGDSLVAADSTNGMYFRYKDDVNSGKWQAVTSSGGVRTATDTGVTATTTFSIFDIRVNAAGTSVTFYIDDVLVATNTTNIPTSTQKFGPQWSMLKSVGTTSLTNYMDWYELTITYASAR
jgi:hypothetical protein